MDRQQANEESKRKNPGSRSLRCIWYCGKINEEIRRAVKLGEKSVKIAFPPKHYFKYIQPSEWYFTLGWEDEK